MVKFESITYNDIIICTPCMIQRNGQSPFWQLTKDTNHAELANQLYAHRDRYHNNMFIGDMWDFANHNAESSQREDRRTVNKVKLK